MTKVKAACTFMALIVTNIGAQSTSTTIPQSIKVGLSGKEQYQSLALALADAKPFSIIEVGPGTYSEKVVIRKPVTIKGAGWDKTILVSQEADDLSPAMLNKINQIASQLNGMKAWSPKWRKLNDTYIELIESHQCPTVLVYKTKGVELSRLQIKLLKTNINRGHPQGGALMCRQGAMTIKDSAFIGSAWSGILIGPKATAKIRQCFVTAAWSSGIVIRGKHAEISNCDIRYGYYCGIDIRNPQSSAIISHCRVTESGFHGINYGKGSPTVTNNLIARNWRTGMYISGASKSTIRGNLFLENEFCGLCCWYESMDTIDNNSFVANKREGLAIYGDANPKISRNIFLGNPTGVLVGNPTATAPYSVAPDKVTFTDNLFWKNKTTTICHTPSNQTFEIPKCWEKGNRITDPYLHPKNNYIPDVKSIAFRHKIGASKFPCLKSPWPPQPEEKAFAEKRPGW